MTEKSTDKATWWSITVFNSEISRVEDEANYPHYVKKVWGGREKCPETGTEHFQGCLQLTTQMRLSALKSWLPTAHFEVAKSTEALKKYAMKADTSTGEKIIRENPTKFYSAENILKLIAAEPEVRFMYRARQADSQTRFWVGVREILTVKPELAGQLMNPSLKAFWKETENVWIDHSITDQTNCVKCHRIEHKCECIIKMFS